AKQYNLPSPPVGRIFAMLQPIVGWLEFHDVAHVADMLGPPLSKWPIMAEPSSVPFVQLPHVMSGKGTPGKAVPSGREPVRMSCWLGVFVRSLAATFPRSSSAVSLLMLFASEWSSATLRAM